MSWTLATAVAQGKALVIVSPFAALKSISSLDQVETSILGRPCARSWWNGQPMAALVCTAAAAEPSGFGAQETGNGARTVPVLGPGGGETSDALAFRFRSIAAGRSGLGLSPTGSLGGGIEWVDVVSSLVVARLGGRRARGGVVLELETEFACRFFWPVVLGIADLAAVGVSHEVAYRQLSAVVDRLGVAHLGLPHTRLALPAAARSAPPHRSWAAAARAAVRGALAGRVGAGTTERCLVYAAACLIWRDEMVELPGTTYASLPRGPPAPIGESPEDRARALLRHVHRHVLRDNHAERAALLAVATAAVRLSGDGQGGSVLAECVGEVQVFASHVPCVSCAAAVAQFARFLPSVHMEFEFEDAWREQPGGAAAAAKSGPPEGRAAPWSRPGQPLGGTAPAVWT
uniref:Uncharacterized protein n=1 Tax=Alexandrium monilatum TaxID=311494 RepID=A0A7S4QAF3_9DINO